MAKKKPVATKTRTAEPRYDRRSDSRTSNVEPQASNVKRGKAPSLMASKPPQSVNSKEIRSKHKEFLFPCVANYYEEPVVLTKGKGSWAWDADGREYLDFFGGILTLGLGHCHDEVVTAVQNQLEQLGHTSTLYPTAGIVNVAE